MHVKELKSTICMTHPNNNSAFGVGFQFLGLSTGSRATRSAAVLRSAVASCLQTSLVVIQRKGDCSLHGPPVQRECNQRTNRCVTRSLQQIRFYQMTVFLLKFTYFGSRVFFWSHLNKTLLYPGKQVTLILVSRATAQTAQCPPLQNPAPLVAAAPHHTPRPTPALTFLTLHSFVAHIPLSVRMRRKHKTVLRWSVRPLSVHPHPDATRPSRSWSPKRTTTAQTPLVPWRR